MQKSLRYCQGSSLLEGLLAILIFSIGLISILNLLTTSLMEVGNARYRIEASLIANSVITDMRTGERSLENLRSRYGNDNAIEYKKWREIVTAKLPGITATANKPEITINNDRGVKIQIKWQTPGDKNSHNFIISAVITD